MKTEQPRGPGRPRVRPEGSVTRSYSLDKRAHDKVSRYAKKHGVSRSQAATDLILSSKLP